jgi:hypothetical protein
MSELPQVNFCQPSLNFKQPTGGFMRALSVLTMGWLSLAATFVAPSAYGQQGGLMTSLQGYYDGLPPETRAYLDQNILNPIKSEFASIDAAESWGDPQFAWDDQEDGKLVRFYRVYKQLLIELNHQDEKPFVGYPEEVKIRRDLQRKVMFQISSDSRSPYFGVHDLVWEDLYGNCQTTPPTFEQLNYEPLLSRIPGLEIFKPVLGVVGALATMNLLQQGDTASLVAGGVLAVVLTAFLGQDFIRPFVGTEIPMVNPPSGEKESGGASSNTDPQQWVRIIMQVATIWSTIQETHDGFTRALEELMPGIKTAIEEAGNLQLTEEGKNQLIMTVSVTVMGLLADYMAEQQRLGQQRDLFTNLSGFFKSLNVEILLDRFLENAQHYIQHQALRDFVLKSGRQSDPIIRLLRGAHGAYVRLLAQVTELIQNIRELMSQNGSTFQENEFHGRYRDSIRTYVEHRLPDKMNR